ncbi:MAG TPA: tRNA (adenosine(37)-N6)-threonylcarbamoyltransferase complex transferase subunit TsaD [Bacteroidota bacterium]|nr:tRNA (adenosine(37)-N6)-threonylcarbamoyltransferase complex transferase subunit TsaD [Bacteroidota bacterium]
MIILGIETSCDETSAAVIRDGPGGTGRLLSNITKTQLFHSNYGGVVPELASRAHQKLIVPIVEEALRKAGVTKNDLDAVAAVYGPGLIGAILVGLSFGKAMAMGLGIPFIGVNHMEAHIFSNLLEDPKPSFPFINLTVSGGHTQLVLVKRPFEYEMLGETKDDAAGEAFDKVAKMLGIGYPGGPMIDKFAATGNPKFVEFPRSYLDEGSFDFSFSGLKTSVLYYLRKIGFDPTKQNSRLAPTSSTSGLVADICASFQSAVIDVLVYKTVAAAEKYGVKEIAIAGGVAANSELRRRLGQIAKERGYHVFIPRMEYCTDNGAMIAMVGFMKMKEGKTSDFELTAEPNLELETSEQ